MSSSGTFLKMENWRTTGIWNIASVSLRMATTDLFKTPDDLVEEAYDRQGERIAYQEDEKARQARDLAYA